MSKRVALSQTRNPVIRKFDSAGSDNLTAKHRGIMGNIPAVRGFLFAREFENGVETADWLAANDDESAILVRSVTVIGRRI